jgi:hypothetical protein
VRLQLAGGGSPFTIAKDIVAKDGFLKLYTGLSAGVLRQVTYTSSRLGIFKCVWRAGGAAGRSGAAAARELAARARCDAGARTRTRSLFRRCRWFRRQRACCQADALSLPARAQHAVREAEGGQRGQAHPAVPEGRRRCAPFAMRARARTSQQPLPATRHKQHSRRTPSAGLTAGGLGAIVGSPADLSLIRMQADGTLPIEKRRNYAGVGAALSTIIREEGIMGLFTGAGPTAVRAMALNMGMLASNDQAKEMLTAQGITGAPNMFGASAIAGFFASFFSLPFDYVKTQLQKMQPLPDGTMPYKGALDCAAKTFAAGGPTKFYTGFPTFYFRIAPHAMITLIMQDVIGNLQKQNGL